MQSSATDCAMLCLRPALFRCELTVVHSVVQYATQNRAGNRGPLPVDQHVHAKAQEGAEAEKPGAGRADVFRKKHYANSQRQKHAEDAAPGKRQATQDAGAEAQQDDEEFCFVHISFRSRRFAYGTFSFYFVSPHGGSGRRGERGPRFHQVSG